VTALPRLRQAVIAVRDLDAVAGRLREELGLDEPYRDPAVGYFGLRNAVFALGDTFLEIVSPVREDTAAGRLIDRRGGDCGYMLMFQVEDLTTARTRAAAEHVREVFAVDLDDMAEVHLHPADMRAAIVSLSAPAPPSAWRWGGPGWQARAAPLRVAGARVRVAGHEALAARWSRVIGGLPGIDVEHDPHESGLVEIALAGGEVAPRSVELERVKVVVRRDDHSQEEDA
jgi:hypothetical protein